MSVVQQPDRPGYAPCDEGGHQNSIITEASSMIQLRLIREAIVVFIPCVGFGSHGCSCCLITFNPDLICQSLESLS